MSKGNNLQSLFGGILFCISVAALVIACLAFTKKGGGEYYEERLSTSYPACEECDTCDTRCCPRTSSGKPYPWGQCGEGVPSHCCNSYTDSEQCAECIKKCTSLNPPAECTHGAQPARGSPHN